MQVVVCNQVGSLDQLVVEERPSPDLYPTCVRIAVTACGVNYVDALFVQGKYQIKPPTPFTPGMEVVGRVTEVASDVAGIKIGDRVFANIGLGGYVSEAVVAASRVVVLPESLTDGQAATFMQSYLTGWFALVERARVETGKWLLVLGGGGGVGLAAVDLGHALGLRVIAVASTDEKRALATQIKGAQDPEISQMKSLLTTWSKPMEMGSMDHSSMMDGMLSLEDMDSLGQLKGAEFDKAWAKGMIGHHEGAIKMANDVLAKGKNSEILALAQAVVSGQTAEIETLKPLAG